jgi:hypothetical protein
MTPEKKDPISDIARQVVRSVVVAAVLVVALLFLSNWAFGWPEDSFLGPTHSVRER